MEEKHISALLIAAGEDEGEDQCPHGKETLRKLMSNAKNAFEGLLPENLGTQFTLHFNQEHVKTLRIHWQLGQENGK